MKKAVDTKLNGALPSNTETPNTTTLAAISDSINKRNLSPPLTIKQLKKYKE